MIVALVLVSAFLHALWNALLRLEPDKDRGLVAAVIVATVMAAVVAGARALAGEVLFASASALGWALAAGVLEWLYFASLARALDRGPLGPIYTVSRGGAILVVWPLSIALFDERFAVASAVGSAIVLVGLALASASSEERRVDRGALAWAIACAFSIAGYHLAYKAALAAGGNPSAVFAVALALASGINVTRARGTVAYARARWRRVVVMGLVCGGSFLILLEGLAAGGAGFVLTLRNTSVLFATALAFGIGDRPRRVQILGSVAVAAGAVVMAWP
ncbi:MAG TPA: hypothetical protein VMJ10_32100 [Kofleriaceae bacterium]|nr:hypothetical protein [Kofleriaceae bacterium]